jgi:hypothetical protein
MLLLSSLPAQAASMIANINNPARFADFPKRNPSQKVQPRKEPRRF